ncbi:PAS domain S-box protein [Candidatus Ozemobacteraceae bacterium]|nr:PAS domain S-box protein [Candidatus Ozemobacteraceae bacterium]
MIGGVSDAPCTGNSLEELEAELARAEAARDALLREAAEYRCALDLARDFAGVTIWTIDLGSRTMSFGTNPCSLPLAGNLHPDDLDALLHDASRLRPDHPGLHMNLRIRGDGGRWEWLGFDGDVERFDPAGRPLFLAGIKKNISDEVLLERHLAEDRKLLEELLDNSLAILYRYNTERKEPIYVNPALMEYALPEYDKTFWQMIESGLESVHPDEREYVTAGFRRTVSNLKSPTTFTLEYRRKNIQGEYRWNYDVITLIPDLRGNVQTMLGSAVDISNLKEAEATLRTSEERYRLVTTLSSSIIWTTDLEKNFTYCSPAVFDMLGYTPDEIIALGPRKTFLPESFRRIERLERDIQLQEAKPSSAFTSRVVQLWQRHKSGRAVVTEVAISVIRDESGRVSGYFGVTRDITGFHELKESLRTSREMLENRVLERTAELLRANEHLRQEIERRRQVEAALLEMSEAEQRSIGHELHDGLCQQLAGIMCLCEAAREHLLEIGSIDAIQMGRIHDLLAGAVRYARYMARGLSPLFIDVNGLSDSLDALASSAPMMFRISCSFSKSGKFSVEDPEQALNLYRIARLAVQNAAHDGNASHVDILLKTTSKSVSLVVSDDGMPRAVAVCPSDYGHCMIDYRMRTMAGSVFLKNRHGGGTVVRCVAPLRRHEKGEENAAKA